MYDVELIIPSSLQNALEIISYNPDLKPIAGGTDIIPRLHKKKHLEQLKAHPIFSDDENKLQKFIDISNIDELHTIETKNSHIEIGAGVTHAELIASSVVNIYFPALVTAVSQIGSQQIRNRGTIGGNIMNASPAADSVPPLFVLDAFAVVASAHQERIIPIRELLKAPGETFLRKNELLFKINLPIIFSQAIQFYRRIAVRKAHACAKASVAFFAQLIDETLCNVRIAFGAVGPTVIFSQNTALLMEGKKLSSQLIEEVSQAAADEVTPIDDIRSTKDYRKAMIAQLLKQGLQKNYRI